MYRMKRLIGVLTPQITQLTRNHANLLLEPHYLITTEYTHLNINFQMLRNVITSQNEGWSKGKKHRKRSVLFLCSAPLFLGHEGLKVINTGKCCRIVLNVVDNLLQKLPDVFSLWVVCNVKQIMDLEGPVQPRQKTWNSCGLSLQDYECLLQVAPRSSCQQQWCPCCLRNSLCW